jgi:hypothetical protein
MSWIANVIRRTAAREGSYASLNPNSDGAGLSFGILQWTQASGNLGKLLATMYGMDPAAFVQIFGSLWQALLAATAQAGIRSVGGAHLWQEPWASRFRAAGNHPAFQRAQDHLAQTDQHMQAALAVAGTLGVMTERSMAIFFDTAVQQGPNGVRTIAENTKTHFTSRGVTAVPYNDLLTTFVNKCLERVRRSSPPDPNSKSFSRWHQVGREWHLYAGSVDLYKAIYARRTALLADVELSDLPIQAGSSAVA